MEHKQSFDGHQSLGNSVATSELTAHARLIEQYFDLHKTDLFTDDRSLTHEHVRELEAKAAPGSEDFQVLSFVDKHFDELKQLGKESPSDWIKRVHGPGITAKSIEFLQDVDPQKEEAAIRKDGTLAYLGDGLQGAFLGGMSGVTLAMMGGIGDVGIITGMVTGGASGAAAELGKSLLRDDSVVDRHIQGALFGAGLGGAAALGLAAVVATTPLWVLPAAGVALGIAGGEYAAYHQRKDRRNFYEQKRQTAASLLSDFK